MTPLERAARALHKLYTEEKERAGAKDMPSWGELGDDGRYYFTHRARAVLQAIREPSEGMNLAGKRADWPDINNPEPSCVWQAMIDKALEEE